MDDLRERFSTHVDTCAVLLAKDLVALLQRAHALGIAICPDVDSEGISYSLDWAFGGQHRSLDVQWLQDRGEWTAVLQHSEPNGGEHQPAHGHEQEGDGS